MKRFVMFAACMILGVAMAACAGAGGFSNEKIRYKMTVTVETPEGVKTGYAVREASRYTEPSILPDQGGTMYNIIKGEAVVVDLESRGTLFVIMDGEREAKAVMKALTQSVSVDFFTMQPKFYPRFIYFKNNHDPKSVEKVSQKLLHEVYGEGVALRQISIAKANEDIIYTIHAYIPWVSTSVGYISGKRINGPSLYENLDSGDFLRKNKE